MSDLWPFDRSRNYKYQPVWLFIALFVIASVAGSIWLLVFDGLSLVQNVLVRVNSRIEGAEGNLPWLIAYAIVCLLSQLLIVPSGSLILIAAGFIFSPLLAAGIFSVAQVICSWPVYSIGKIVSEKFPHRFRSLTKRFKFPTDWEHIVQQEGFLATVVLRLTPVIPSAAACLLAAGLAIDFTKFILATIAVCWIRPLFFASIGGSLQALTDLSDASGGVTTFKPLLLMFIAALVLLLVKVFLRLSRA